MSSAISRIYQGYVVIIAGIVNRDYRRGEVKILGAACFQAASPFKISSSTVLQYSLKYHCQFVGQFESTF